MPIKYNRSILLIIYFLLAGCIVTVQGESTATAEPLIITATLLPTTTPSPTETLPPSPPQPTFVPADGITSTQLNVRAEPSTASEVLGIIAANSTVQIVGKDVGENWWQITYEAGVDGKGWVTAQYVETVNKPEVPVIGGDESNPQSGNTAIVIQQINVRSGPGTSFNSLDVLNKNDVVNLTGKNTSGTWLQIDFPAGPDGSGWVNSGFVKSDNISSLSIISDAGDVIGTGTPVNTPPPPGATFAPAPMDFDTADAPIKTVLLGGAGTHTALYNGNVSFPEGDTEDWISIIPQENNLFVSFICMESEAVKIESIGMDINLQCNKSMQKISVMQGSPFLIHIEAIGLANQSQFTNYILEIKVNP